MEAVDIDAAASLTLDASDAAVVGNRRIREPGCLDTVRADLEVTRAVRGYEEEDVLKVYERRAAEIAADIGE
jgi:hypothetical protein